MTEIIESISFYQLYGINNSIYNNNTQVIEYIKTLRNNSVNTVASLLLLSLLDNFEGNFNSAEECIIKAFKLEKNIMKQLFDFNDRNHYILLKNEYDLIKVEECPVCNTSDIKTINVSLCVNHNGFNTNFSPFLCWGTCKNCNHVFLEKLNSSEAVVDDAITEEFYKFIDVKKKYGMDFDSIIHLKELITGNKILEIGPGSGSMMSVLKDLKFECLGIELQKASVKNCRIQGLKVIYGNFNDINLQEKFNLIIMQDVIEHIFEVNSVIRKCSELLSENGILWISTPIFDNQPLIDLRKKGLDPYFQELEHVHYFTKSSLLYLLKKNGFRLSSERPNLSYIGSIGFTFIKNMV